MNSSVTGIAQVADAVNMAYQDGRLRIAGPDSEIETSCECALRAIGPTSAALLADRLGELTPEEIVRRIRNANYTSTVLWLKSGEIRALLGADLDHRDKVLGWKALIDEHKTKHWLENASLVKVPHHGSVNGHEREMYQRWTSQPVAVVTANNMSGLPDSGAVERLGAHCEQIHCTSGPASGPDGASGDISQDRRTGSNGETGAVIARRRPGEASWRVEYRGPAAQLT